MKPFDWKCGCTQGRNIPQKGVPMKKASYKASASKVKKAVKKVSKKGK